MIVEFYDQMGGQALRMRAAQVIIRTDDGTPLAVASVYGPEGGHLVETASPDPRQQERFQRALRTLGVNQLVIVDEVQDLPVPAGAKLLGM